MNSETRNPVYPMAHLLPYCVTRLTVIARFSFNWKFGGEGSSVFQVWSRHGPSLVRHLYSLAHCSSSPLTLLLVAPQYFAFDWRRRTRAKGDFISTQASA